MSKLGLKSIFDNTVPLLPLGTSRQPSEERENHSHCNSVDGPPVENIGQQDMQRD